MKDLSDILTSRARYRVLSILSLRETPIHLRALSELAGIQVRSAQVALEALLKGRVVVAAIEGNRRSFSLNARSASYPALKELFLKERKDHLVERAKRYVVATSALRVVDQLRGLSWRASEPRGK